MGESREVKDVCNACEQEIREKSHIAWECIQETHEAYGSPITETLVTDLKEELNHHIEGAVKEASELMAHRLRFMKPEPRLIDLESTECEVKKGFGVKVDNYVDSILC